MNHEDFFAFARERYEIKLRRDAGIKPPWTKDAVLQEYRFCHVFREDDRTTKWFRENITKPLGHDRKKITFATFAFRWFNRVEVGELIKRYLLGEWSSREVRKWLQDVRPVVTGAYMIRTPTGLNKLDGILWYIDNMVLNHSDKLHTIAWNCNSLQEAWKTALPIEGMGPFLAYEVITDLNHTCVLSHATDGLSWANPGPGARRGLEWLMEADSVSKAELLPLMQNLLHISKQRSMWPAKWPAWDMRTVEHTLCEYDKWRRGHEGQRLKRRFKV